MNEVSSDIVVMIVSWTLVLLLLLGFIISFILLYKNRQVKHQREMEFVTHAFNQEILRTQLESREQTLKNISQEIHDNVGQVLSLAILNLSSIDKQDAKIERITGLVEKAVTDLRNLSKTMDPEYIATLGLAAAIKFELELLEKTGMYKTNFILAGAERKLNGSGEIVIYRIVQESLNNIIKHAKATQVNISMAFAQNWLTLEISDDGTGIKSKPLNGTATAGAGIRNMKNRAALIGASLELQSEAGKGTRIFLTVPDKTGSPL